VPLLLLLPSSATFQAPRAELLERRDEKAKRCEGQVIQERAEKTKKSDEQHGGEGRLVNAYVEACYQNSPRRC
jgi:predicted kinase